MRKRAVYPLKNVDAIFGAHFHIRILCGQRANIVLFVNVFLHSASAPLKEADSLELQQTGTIKASHPAKY